jgi:hypothetical protein
MRATSEHLLEVNSLVLNKASCDEACLVLDYGVVLVALHLEDPLQLDWPASWWRIDVLS